MPSVPIVAFLEFSLSDPKGDQWHHLREFRVEDNQSSLFYVLRGSYVPPDRVLKGPRTPVPNSGTYRNKFNLLQAL